jgi:hypothetical protein
MLADNGEGNLDTQQIEFAETIHAAGNDLLALINDILDLSKVEAGKMDLNLGQVPIADLCEDVERAFRPVAEQNGLGFTIEQDESLPAAFVTDEQRLQQILRNLLSNAFKFTHDGSVILRIASAHGDLPVDGESLRMADGVIALSVTDTGVGIPDDKLSLIFEAFQQADGTTSRKYGGTGLGLSISREIARLLGGEIHATSMPGTGSTFTLYLPLASRTADAPGEASEALVALPAGGNGDGGAGRQDASFLPFDSVHDDREAIAAGDRILLLIAHDGRRSASRSPATTGPTRSSSSPATAAATSCSASSSSTPTRGTGRSTWSVPPGDGWQRCGPARRATSRSPAAPRRCAGRWRTSSGAARPRSGAWRSSRTASSWTRPR